MFSREAVFSMAESNLGRQGQSLRSVRKWPAPGRWWMTGRAPLPPNGTSQKLHGQWHLKIGLFWHRTFLKAMHNYNTLSISIFENAHKFKLQSQLTGSTENFIPRFSILKIPSNYTVLNILFVSSMITAIRFLLPKGNKCSQIIWELLPCRTLLNFLKLNSEFLDIQLVHLFPARHHTGYSNAKAAILKVCKWMALTGWRASWKEATCC